MRKIKLTVIILAVALIMGLLPACGKSTKIPFSDAKWTWTAADVKAAEGKVVDKYDSVYGGDTYVFDKKFLDFDGLIKYMFDENGRLASVAWAYTADSEEELNKVYTLIQNREIKEHGKSEFSNSNDTADGDVWYLGDCDVLITKLSTTKGHALQYAYISNTYSQKEK